MPGSRIVVGRLLEVDLKAGFRSAAEVDAFSSDVGRWASSGRELVMVADWRRYQVSTPAVAERIVSMLQRHTHHFARIATLFESAAPTAMLQLGRLMQEVQNPKRRTFTDAEALVAWLDEVLDDDERARVRAFLGMRTQG